MTPTKEELREYAKEARDVAQKMLRLSVDLTDAAEGRISASDCDISGTYAAASFVREYVPIIERF